ncbi:UPF0468 protein [Phytophthora palmivora]|uniref:UPF0468 protein n=1 Tax=Phytophthora palmivora TaxID=4796 RepID=A0A2P4YHU8_9STRA|nr:UPF0468 protein [Phytophthora palmivora]
MWSGSSKSGGALGSASCLSKPLQIWDKQVRNGHIKRITDQDIQSSVLEIMGTNVSTNFMTEWSCRLATKETHLQNRSSAWVWVVVFSMPMRLDEGWNQIQFNLSDFTRRAYGTNYIETLRVQIHANCRIRRVIDKEWFDLNQGTLIGAT